jgi:hypothetical protein
MIATFVRSGENYLPAIKSTATGKVKVLYGDPLTTAAAARKYAQIEINKMQTQHGRWVKTRPATNT